MLDRDGKTIGQAECFFNDKETGRPEWIGVFTGTFRHHHSLVPVEGAGRENGAIRVPWTKEQVQEAPQCDLPERGVSEAMQGDAYRHYGLKSAAV